MIGTGAGMSACAESRRGHDGSTVHGGTMLDARGNEQWLELERRCCDALDVAICLCGNGFH